MKVSTKGRYGLKAMVDLAVHSKNGCVCLKSIAQRQQISEAYLEQLAVSLKKHKLIKSVRGAKGGYILGRNAQDISVGDILYALEGDLNIVGCLSDEKYCKIKNCGSCVAKGVWSRLSVSISETANSIKLSELAAESEGMNNI